MREEDVMVSQPNRKQFSSTTPTQKIVEGFTTPDDSPLTPNERGWVELLRLLAPDRDPAPSLEAVQALRAVLTNR